MASVKMLWGFGGVKFVQPYGAAYEKEFTNAKGTLGFTEEKNQWLNKSKKLITKHYGYRPEITVKLWNVSLESPDNAAFLSGLMNLLSNCKESGILVYPRFGTNSTLNYLCTLSSNISPDDIANFAAGQTLELRFTGISPVTSLPTLISDPSINNVTTFYGNLTSSYGNVTMVS